MQLQKDDEVKLFNGVEGKVIAVNGEVIDVYAHAEGMNRKDFTTYIVPLSHIVLVNGKDVKEDKVIKEEEVVEEKDVTDNTC